MEYYRTRYASYGQKAHGREDAIRRQVAHIKKLGVENFVIDAELFKDKRPLWKRLMFGG